MSIVKEFKEFAIKGNVVDLAVGVIIGAAFGKIVASFVADIIMPPLGLLIGQVNFSDLAVILKPAGDAEHPAVVLTYGKFIQAIIDFTIVAFSIFVAVKGINRLRRSEAAAPSVPPAPTREEQLLTEIRDVLKEGK